MTDIELMLALYRDPRTREAALAMADNDRVEAIKIIIPAPRKDAK